MKKIVYFASLFIICIGLFSCESDKLSSDKYIRSYILEAEKNQLESDIRGVIDEKNKTIILEEEVPITRELIATFEGQGEVFIGDKPQTSGVTGNKFDAPLIYTIKAEDGTIVDYILTATPMPHARLKEFSVAFYQNDEEVIFPVKYTEDSSRITMEPPTHYWIENIESAIATFEAEGTVWIDDTEQISGTTRNDFREEHVYTVKAKDGTVRSYTVELVAPQTTGLPIIKVDTEGGADILDKKNYVDANFRLIDPEHPEYEVDKYTGIRGRGNTTWAFPKKPYRIKFDKKTSLFGYGAAKSWVLLANWQDPTFIMNTVAFEVAHRLGLEYTNHPNHVELFLNNRYQGSYVLTEQVQVNEHRVNIDEDSDFFVELDAYFDEDYKWRTPILGLPANIKSPELDDETGMHFVMEAFNAVEAAVMNADFPQTNYADLIDVPVLINYLLVNEIVRNRELEHPKSVFLYKKGEDKIKMGPVWDFDWGFGYMGTGHNYFENPQGLIYFDKQINISEDYPGAKFFFQFFKDPAFCKAYKDRWNEVKGIINDLDTFVEETGRKLLRSGEENRKVWPTYPDYDTQISDMKDWIQTRLVSLDEEINRQF